MQEFIVTSEPTDLTAVKEFLEYNNFHNNRNNDYINSEIGLIFEDLHDENVLSANGVLFFIDTVFLLNSQFLHSVNISLQFILIQFTVKRSYANI